MAERVPGLIIRILDSVGTIVPPLFQRYPVVTGIGDFYKLISDSLLVRRPVLTDVIQSPTTVNEIFSVGDLPGVTKYVSGTDYSLLTGNLISWLPGGDAPTSGDNYYITFTETRAASAFDPTLYLNENLVYDDHGFQIMTNGVLNDVSVGASLVLNAGGNGVIVAQLDPTGFVDPESPTLAELETAFIAMRTKLNLITGYKLFLLGMSSGTLNTTTAADILFNHSVIASQPSRAQERTTIAAMPIGTGYAAFAAYAQSYAHERMVVPATPDGESIVVGHSTVYDTRFYCAALAGKLCGTPIGQGISDEIIPNVLLTGTYSPEELKYLVQRGVSPANPTGTVTRNVMAITTDGTSALTEDLGVQDIKDYVKKYWREGLYPVYRNKKITKNLVLQMIESSEGILDQLIEDENIDEWRDVTVVQDTTEPRKVNISGSIKPAFSLQWIDVVFTFVLSYS